MRLAARDRRSQPPLAQPTRFPAAFGRINGHPPGLPLDQKISSYTVEQVRRLRTILVVTALLAAGGGCAGDDGATTSEADRTPVLLDYSPTLSDAGALLYLASDPTVDLRAVTLPGTGEADCRPGVRTTRALLAIAGAPDVPVGCGRDRPLTGNRDWPEEWRTETNQWSEELLPTVAEDPFVDAEQLLVDTITEATAPVTIVAVAPLTNLGAVLPTHAELADRVDRIVIMGGAVDVAGNVEAAPAAEWNLYIDPEADRRVLDSSIPVTFVPLDATNGVPWTDRLLSRLAVLDAAPARTVHEMAASRDTLVGFYLWDELAAVAATRPDVVTVEERTVTIDDEGAVVSNPDGTTVRVAISADADEATEAFLRTLNGGTLPDLAPLTADERSYLIAMNGADGRFGGATSQVYVAVERSSLGPRRTAEVFVNGFFAAIADYAVELGELDPPAAVSTAHTDYIDALNQVLAGEAQVTDALARAHGDTADELLNNASEDLSLPDLFERAGSICRTIQDFAYLHDGPRPCTADGS